MCEALGKNGKARPLLTLYYVYIKTTHILYTKILRDFYAGKNFYEDTTNLQSSITAHYWLRQNLF